MGNEPGKQPVRDFIREKLEAENVKNIAEYNKKN
jgi:hypothetical protein